MVTELFGNTRDARRCRAYLVGTFDEVRCAVVMHEVMRGSIRRGPARSPTPFWRAYEPMEGVEMVTPDLTDWRRAGAAILEMNARSNYTLGVENLRKMTDDALIASLCVRRGFVLLTADEDFVALRATRELRGLRVIDWKKKRAEVLGS